MATGRCDHCGVEEYMPYVCKFCKGRYCAAHRLPENHNCAQLGAYKERLRAEGRVFAPEQDSLVTPRVSNRAMASASMDALWARLDGKMTYVFLGVIVAVYLLEWVVVVSSGAAAWENLFVISNDFVTKPWTVVTSMFAHSLVNFSHILFNGLVLLFFGQTTERLIGSKRFTGLFLATGVISGVAQVLLSMVLFPGIEIGALGASGAIQGLMGTLVVLAPSLTVLVFFVIPAPLWALAAFYVVYDLLFNVVPGSGVAGIAHLSGLAVGMWYGFHLRKKGLRAVVRRPPPMRPVFGGGR